jgi:hypothetical protein
MPFYGYTTAEELDATPFKDGSILIEWLIDDQTFIHEGTPVATIQCMNSNYTLTINFPAFIDKFLCKPGEEIKASESILKWTADGESIPYGRPYFLLQQNG